MTLRKRIKLMEDRLNRIEDESDCAELLNRIRDIDDWRKAHGMVNPHEPVESPDGEGE